MSDARTTPEKPIGVNLPYFDRFIAASETVEGEAGFAGANVHWGFYEPEEYGDDSAETLWNAAARMTDRVIDAAQVRDGTHVLDVGCGFGGTIDALDRRYAGCRLFGLNIDGRQLSRARGLTGSRGSNDIRWVQGDACRLPLGDASVDTVMAVECIFHFPSRRAFLAEVVRVLRPGGRLVVSDFTWTEVNQRKLGEWSLGGKRSAGFYGTSRLITPRRYERISKAAGLRIAANEDITEATLPTYPALRRMYRDAGWDDGSADNDLMEELSSEGLLDYRILAFDRG